MRIVAAMNESERITRLEERYAHLQRHVVQQDKVMLELSDALAKLRQEVTMLRTKDSGGSDPGDIPNERPPHY